MKKFTVGGLTALALLVISAYAAQAQQSFFGIGPKIGLYVDNANFMIGGVAQFPVTPNITFEPGLEAIIDDNFALIADANARYNFLIRGEAWSPWVMGGLGLGFIFSSGDETDIQTDFRLNIGGGVTFSTRSRVQPWIGLKVFLISESSDVGIQGGVNFYL